MRVAFESPIRKPRRIKVDEQPKASRVERAAQRKKKFSEKAEKRKEKRRLAAKYVQELIERATPAEIAMKEILDRHGIRYEFQKALTKRKDFYIVDFFLKDYATVVEVDGGYHFTPEQQAKDAKRTEAILRKERFARVVRFENGEVFKGDEFVLARLAKEICPWAFG